MFSSGSEIRLAFRMYSPSGFEGELLKYRDEFSPDFVVRDGLPLRFEGNSKVVFRIQEIWRGYSEYVSLALIAGESSSEINEVSRAYFEKNFFQLKEWTRRFSFSDLLFPAMIRIGEFVDSRFLEFSKMNLRAVDPLTKESIVSYLNPLTKEVYGKGEQEAFRVRNKALQEGRGFWKAEEEAYDAEMEVRRKGKTLLE